eukprot:TRINITY_DN7487_c0_g1_i3.p1 TRINITY_DN7487_c0_g1~~TRINITY_DN7487_c0_g1_i3.p1  ORF type:complete len:1514 (-),score=286.83 TRINITY_DN7487_c0_g1_i3:28-4569(-)
MSGREQRKKPERENKALKALSAAREGGEKRSGQYEVRDESVYDNLTDAQYSRMLSQKKKRGDNFVVDDDGRGYDDHGDEYWSEDENETFDDAEEAAVDGKKKSKRPAKSDSKAKAPQKKTPAVKESSRLTSLLAKERSSAAGTGSASFSSQMKSRTSTASSTSNKSDDAFESMLADLASNPLDKAATTSTYTLTSRSKSQAPTPTPGVSFVPSHVPSPAPSPYSAPPPSAITYEDIMRDDEPPAPDPPVDATPAPAPAKPSTSSAPASTAKTAKPSPASKPMPIASAFAKTTPSTQIDSFSDIPDSAFDDVFDPSSVNGPTPSASKPLLSQIVPSASGNDWFSLAASSTAPETPTKSGNASAPLPCDDEGKLLPLSLFWLDATDDQYSRPDVVYLFGKVFSAEQKKYVSCSVTVRNMQRTLYVCPRPYILNEDGESTGVVPTVMDVAKELEGLRQKHTIPRWKCRPVQRIFPFDSHPDIPRTETTFLKVKYDFKFPAFPASTSGRTFCAVLGTHSSPLELFLLKRQVMGPCWLTVKDAKIPNVGVTSCKYEVEVENFRSVERKVPAAGEVLTAPPLVVMGFSIKTVPDPATKAQEVVLVSAVVHNAVNIDGPTPDLKKGYTHFSAIRKLNGRVLPANFTRMAAKDPCLEVCSNERSLLSYVLSKVSSIDPDVIVGHNFWGFDLDVLLHRMESTKIQNWSRLGRLNRSKMPKLQTGKAGHGDSSWQERAVMAGRLVCDTYLSSKEFLREKTYKLGELAKTQLGITRPDIDLEDLPKYMEMAEDLQHLVKYAENDCFLALSLMDKLMVLPLTKQLSNLAGNLWGHTLMGSRAERIEYLLLHEFYDDMKTVDGGKQRKYIVPEKETAKEREAKKRKEAAEDGSAASSSSSSSRRKPAYSGGLVLEPEKGLYDHYVLLLDFNSLYPSIIQEYNICFTSIERHRLPGGKWEEASPPDKDVTQGVLPRVLKTLVERRRAVKGQIKNERDPVKLQQLDIRQQALKLTANSMYGCLGFTFSRFYAMPLAELVTRKGRETLQRAVDETRNKMGMHVIYGDTDSIMIHTGLDDLAKVKARGLEIKKEINKLFNLLEIEVDGIFKTMLLLKKKKYAALRVEEKPDGTVASVKQMKGLDLVRRDWCDLSRDMGNVVLDFILSGATRDEVVERIHKYLQEQALAIRENKIPLQKYIVNKGLTKHPKEYPDAKSQPHVQVALKMLAQNKPIQVGDTIPYVITEGPDSWAERACHPDDIVRSDGLVKVDINWYLAQQVYPPIARLCENIEGTDASQLANCLGLDGTKFAHRNTPSGSSGSDDVHLTPMMLMDEEERYKSCDKWLIVCPSCNREGQFVGPLRTVETSKSGSSSSTRRLEASGLQCEECRATYPVGYLCNQLTLQVRRHIERYYQGRMQCDEGSCHNESRQLYFRGSAPKCSYPGCRGTMMLLFDELALHNQLMYLAYLVDVEKCCANKRKANKDVYIPEISREARQIFDKLKQKVASTLGKNAYHHVPLGELFSFHFKK